MEVISAESPYHYNHLSIEFLLWKVLKIYP